MLVFSHTSLLYKGDTLMYIPSHFEMKDKQMAYDLIKGYSFATLFSQHEGLPYVTHLPLVLNSERTYLYGHFAQPNPQWKDIKNQTVLAVFHGPHCYISPSWYETNKAVPTWNYVAVHVYGEVELVTSEEELKKSLEELVNQYEGPNSSYRMEEVDSGYLRGMSKGVQGFKIKINRIEGKAKLSQNHPVIRQELVIQQLAQRTTTDELAIAKLMKVHLNQE